MDSKIKGKTSSSESSSESSKFNKEIRRLDELGGEYLEADAGWERDDIRFTELYNIIIKLSKPGGLPKWMFGTYANREESVNFNFSVLLDKYKELGAACGSFFAFLYASMRRALLNGLRNSGSLGYRSSSSVNGEEVQLPTTSDIDQWMRGAEIEDKENDERSDVPESKNDDAIISIVSCMIRFVLDLSDNNEQKDFPFLQHALPHKIYADRNQSV